MALVSATEMLNKAHEGHYAVGAFNINNMEWTKAILLAAEEAKSPVMLGVSEGAAKYMCGFKTVVAMVKEIHDNLGITVPVALHLSLIHIFIGEYSRRRTEVVPSTASYDIGRYASFPVEVQVGGATIFVIDVEKFIKL